MSESLQPYFSVKATENETLAKFRTSSPWKSAPVAFNFINFDYPTYHSHADFCEILLLLSGEMLHTVNGRQYRMQPGACYLINKDFQHKFSFLSPTPPKNKCVAINFLIRYEFFLEVLSLFGERTRVALEDPERLYICTFDTVKRNDLFRQTVSLHTSNDPSPDTVAEVKSIIAEILLIYIRQTFAESRKMPAWLNEFLVTLQDPANFQRPLPELLSQIPYCYSYIAREFKRYMDCSLVTYINSVKMRQAKELLASTDMAMIHISSYLGFDSLSHFNHLFKKSFNVTPSEYRRSLQSE